MYYTYAFLREDRTPYYIGKGKGNRAYRRKRNDIKPPKDKSRTIFLKQNLTEEEAFRHEIYMIAIFGRKDLGTGILHNKTDGGDGVSGKIWSDEERINKSKSMMGKNNHFYGKTHTNENKEIIKKSKIGKRISDEEKMNKSKSMMGKNNHFYKKTHTDENKETMRLAKLKYLYILQNPQNEIFTTNNLRMFCENNNLSYPTMCNIANKKGRNKTNKGWKVLEKRTVNELAQDPCHDPQSVL